MLSRILVPLDGSPLSEGVLVHVRRLLYREDAEVELVQVLSPVAGDADDEATARDREVRRRAAEYLDRIRDDLRGAGATARATILAGDPAEEIVARAEEIDASLVAMSTHGRSGLSRWFRGSVAERVLREAKRPLLLANPAGDRGGGEKPAEIEFRRILVPLDGSETAARILPLVRALADLYRAEIVILHSPPVTAAALTYPEWETPVPGPDPDVLVRPYRDELVAAGYDVRVVTGVGLPASDILDAVDEQAADLVAMTTHGRTGLSRWIFGSVAEKVLRHCRAPLLVLRTDGAVR